MTEKKPLSQNTQKALDLLHFVRENKLTLEERMDYSVKLAGFILDESSRVQTFQERQLQNQMSRMMHDPMGKVFTTSLTDQCFRSKRPSRIADQMVYLMKHYGIPRYFSPFKRMQLKAFELFGKPFAKILVPLTIFSLRRETARTIISADPAKLAAHIEKRKAEGVKINLNRLGEAMLGEKDAKMRHQVYCNDLENPLITYMSIKISTIYSQINMLAREKTLKALSKSLAELYRVAKKNSFINEQGKSCYKFINLDMEEYKDLHLTVDLFKEVLSQEEFKDLPAGIVLQAYLPDSFHLQQDLTEWAKKRVAAGGAHIKIRIVKGANMMPESAEGGLYGWPQAPYQSKADTDANYKRMVTYGLAAENAKAVHIGIGSHNLFDIAYALVLRAENGIEECTIFEMLEGMADNMRRAVQAVAGDMLLYCPVATKKDFQNAVAYLIRRLDENTAKDNFLRHAFDLKPGSSDWDEQVARFKKSCKEMNSVFAGARRTQNRNVKPEMRPHGTSYHHEEDTDFTLPQNIKWADTLRAMAAKTTYLPIPLCIGGKIIQKSGEKTGVCKDPANPEATLTHYDLASIEEVNQALDSAKAYQPKWESTSFQERARLLRAAAQLIRENRGKLLVTAMKSVGKIFQEGDPEISEAVDFANYYAHSLFEMESHTDIEWKAKGTVLVASPWNFPLAIPCGGITGALAAGNCVIFKPAPEAVLCGWELVNLLWEAGIPKEALQFINCEDDPVGSALIKDPRVDTVILTGATKTASLFLQMRPGLDLAAETGGKNTMIITAMSDRDLAIKDLIQSAFGHAGQKCSAASIAILEAEVYDDPHFQIHLRDAVESLAVGLATDPGTKVPPLTCAASEALLRGITTLEPGEYWLLEPKQDKTHPHLFSPGIKYGVKPGSFMHTTELFGPVLGVMRAKDLNHAIELANATPYGLTAGIHTLDEREKAIWINKIEAGNLYVNRGTTGAIVQRQPFGGWKSSSYGKGIKAGGVNYVCQFTHPVQKALPTHKKPVCESVNQLTRLLDGIPLSGEEQGLFQASITNYAYWYPFFQEKSDKDLVIGQDNLAIYKNVNKMALRIQKGDSALDIVRILAAALTCKTELEVSYEEGETPLNFSSATTKHLHGLVFTQQSAVQFNTKVQEGAFTRVRLASAPSHALKFCAAQSMTYLNADPVLANGRYELLNYLREESISHNYHRYGYLGVREAEHRTKVL